MSNWLRFVVAIDPGVWLRFAAANANHDNRPTQNRNGVRKDIRLPRTDSKSLGKGPAITPAPRRLTLEPPTLRHGNTRSAPT